MHLLWIFNVMKSISLSVWFALYKLMRTREQCNWAGNVADDFDRPDVVSESIIAMLFLIMSYALKYYATHSLLRNIKSTH